MVMVMAGACSSGEQSAGFDENGEALGGIGSAVFAGPQHTCAVLANGSVRCWGVNAGGQLGNGTLASVGDDETPDATTPVPLFGVLNPGWYFDDRLGLEVWIVDESSDAQSSSIAMFVKNASTQPVSELRAYYSFTTSERAAATGALQEH
jgi:Regulator of chromosome condensation (RCC1) repeat